MNELVKLFESAAQMGSCVLKIMRIRDGRIKDRSYYIRLEIVPFSYQNRLSC